VNQDRKASLAHIQWNLNLLQIYGFIWNYQEL
jgi:hypothetical protein